MPQKVTLDPHHEKILDALDGHLDHVVFEACAVELVRQDGWPVVPVIGGQDDGFDGAVADGKGEPFPLISTIGEDLVGNFKKNVKQAQRKGWKADRAIFATSGDITPQTRRNLYESAREVNITLVQAYPRDWFAYRLYHNPYWCKHLLGLTGRPRALSVFPRTDRPRLGDHVSGRESETQWLKGSQGDCLLVGGPGSGKTFLLQSLANELQALFLVDGDREQIANDVRELEPSAVIIDDAHVNPDLIRSFDQLRKEIDAEHIRIIATCWISEVDQVRGALRLANQNVLHLDLIEADKMVEIIKSFGIEGPNELIATIRQQAAGRPGLAATLADLCLKGNVQRVISGEGLVDQLSAQLSKTFVVDVKRLLAVFALGGDAGVSQSEAASFLGISDLEISERLARLAAGGVLRERGNRALSVEPDPMRWVLVRDVFFGGVGSLDYTSLLEVVENPIDVIATLIRANSRGAQIPYLLQLVERADSEHLWSDYAWLGPSEAEYVITNSPEMILVDEIARASLRHVPEIALPQLLDRAGEAGGPRDKDPTKILENWINDSHRARKNGILERVTLVRSAHRWWKQTHRARTAIRVMCIGLKPVFEYYTLDPGAGSTITSTQGTIPGPLLIEIIRLWPCIKEIIREGEGVPCTELLRLIDEWRLYRDPNVEISEETKTVTQEFAERMLRDLAEATRQHPGIQHQLQNSAKAMDLSIDLSLDPVFESFYGWRLPEEEDELIDSAMKHLGVTCRSIGDLAESLARIRAEALLADIDLGSSWVAEQICRKIADVTKDPVKAATEFMHHRLPGEWLHPILFKATIESHHGWRSVMSLCLNDKSYQNIAVCVILTLPYPDPEFFASSLALAENLHSLIYQLCFQSKVPEETLRALMRANHPGVAATAAIGHWTGEPKGKIKSVDECLWRRAILCTVYDDALLNRHKIYGYRLCEILASDSKLAEEWLLTLLGQGHDRLSFHAEEIAAESVIPAMDLKQRRKALRALPTQWNWTVDKIVRHLVGQDLDLYQKLLDAKALSQYHLSPLVGKPNRAWWMRAALALDAGYSVKDVVQATGVSTGSSWMGSESNMWADWRSAFQGLLDLGELDPQISQVVRLGARIAGEWEKDSLREERFRAVHVS